METAREEVKKAATKAMRADDSGEKEAAELIQSIMIEKVEVAADQAKKEAEERKAEVQETAVADLKESKTGDEEVADVRKAVVGILKRLISVANNEFGVFLTSLENYKRCGRVMCDPVVGGRKSRKSIKPRKRRTQKRHTKSHKKRKKSRMGRSPHKSRMGRSSHKSRRHRKTRR